MPATIIFMVTNLGGEYAKEPLLTRCGAGVAIFPRYGNAEGLDPLVSAGCMAINLPGDQQYPARACLFLINHIMHHTYGYLELLPDCKYIVDGIDQSRR